MKPVTFLLCATLTAAAATACDRESKEGPTSATSSLSPEAQASAKRVLSAYETARAALAKDAIAGVPEAAREIEAAATDLAAKAPANVKPHASALVVAAKALAEERDVEKARAAFGEVSRQVVPMLVIEPSLRNQLFIFECPMAQKYGKWVQPKEKIDNPYMGKAMLTCGSETEWKG